MAGTVQKSSPKIFATSVILIQLAKENHRPAGENSPNLATLLGNQAAGIFSANIFESFFRV
jgi:hypothetical protein